MQLAATACKQLWPQRASLFRDREGDAFDATRQRRPHRRAERAKVVA
jgi:hypothetical protein